MSHERAFRMREFKTNWFSWVAVRHFLPAPMVRELVQAVIDVSSEGKFSLERLFDETISEGPTSLASWAIRPKPIDERFASYLQDYVKAIVWQGDRVLPPTGEFDTGSPEQIENLAASVSLGSADIPRLENGRQPELEQPISYGLLTCLSLATAAQRDGDLKPLIAAICEHFQEPLLRTLIFKHIGDLFVDVENWDLAGTLYESARAHVEEQSEDAWAQLAATILPTIAQSLATVTRTKHGPEAAAKELEAVELSGEVSLNWVSLANIANDLSESSFASHEFIGDRRVALLASPLLGLSHHLSRACENWLEHRYEDAYQWFWSVLRRQIALGEAQSARHTKSLFGQCLIEGADSNFRHNLPVGNVTLGVRLIIESAHRTAAEHTDWSESFVAEVINLSFLQLAEAVSQSAPGYRQQRQVVQLELFTKWFVLLQPEKIEEATFILRSTARLAEAGDTSMFTGWNVRSSAFKSLLGFAKARPEFCAEAEDEVVRSVVSGLDDTSPLIQGDALKVAFAYAKEFGQNAILEMTRATLGSLRDVALMSRESIVSGPAINFLYAAYNTISRTEHAEIRREIARVLLQLSAAGSAEHTAFIALLGSLDKDHAEEFASREHVEEVVTLMREITTQLNRSDASHNINALLDAATIVKWRGIEAGLNGLIAAISSAKNDRASAALMSAFKPLLSLVHNIDEITAETRAAGKDPDTYLSAIFDALVSMWQEAPHKPLIFRAFALPLPSTPNSAIIHNWAFASLAFGRLLNREREIEDALDAAAQNLVLKDTIATARNVATPVGNLEQLTPERLREQPRQAFYSALGQWLVSITGLPSDKQREYVTTLLEECYRVGPRGEDAGVFALAVGLGVKTGRSNEARAYKLRLGNDRQLRLSLNPLVSQVISPD